MFSSARLRAPLSLRLRQRPPLSDSERAMRRFSIALAIAALLCVGALSSAYAQDNPTPTLPAGAQYYQVRSGDSWSMVARRFGITYAELRAANPNSGTVNNWLRTGETLIIPAPAGAEITVVTSDAPVADAPADTAAAQGTAAEFANVSGEPELFHTVAPGESWNSIANLYEISPSLLRAANPRAVRNGLVLFRGERLLIPPAPAAGGGDALQGASFRTPTPIGATVTPTATLTPQGGLSTPTETATPTLSPTPTETFTPSPTPTEVTTTGKDVDPNQGTSPLPTAPTQAPTVAPTATIQTAIGVACPATFGDYAAAINSILNTESFGTEGLQSWLRDCGARVDDGIRTKDLTGDGSDELIVIYADPSAPAGTSANDMIVLNYGAGGFTETYRARAAGKVQVWRTEDINADGKMDILYSDTTCGASTCYDGINVISWDGSQWQNWTDSSIGMAYAEYRVQDVSDKGQGNEITLTGGVHGSTGAGPQRSRSEIWASISGAPYTLLERTYDSSECLYFAVIDANKAFSTLPNIDLDELERLYTKAATDPTLTTCWNRPNEDAELRSFSLFRLALVAAYQGVPEISRDLFASIQHIYPDSIYGQAGQVWLDAFAANKSIPEACAAVNAFGAANPAAVEYLADYGYANRAFSASEICPVQNIAVSTTSPAAVAAAAPVAAAVSAVEMGTSPLPTAAPTVEVGQLPSCPDSLAGYTTAVSALLNGVGANSQVVWDWLEECGALDDTRGTVIFGDYSGDGITDAVVLPVIVSDNGFGPKGTQGAVLIFNGTASGGFTLAANPEVYGQPALIATDDITGDGRADLGWTVTGCSTFCVTEIQVVSWDEGTATYASQIQPGATLAEGTVRIVPIPDGELGTGKQIVLTGGVSGTPEGGLDVPHTEVWRSDDGAPFRRVSWTYDREVQGNECLGLRLVEADVLLEAADIIGFGPALDAYTATFDPSLKACSIFGIDGTEELKLLQGLASFRLVQAQMLAGSQNNAQNSIAALTQGQPEGAFTAATQTWAARYAETGDAQAACDAVASFFGENELTWQITDHFGYNHPALAAAQLCFVPKS